MPAVPIVIGGVTVFTITTSTWVMIGLMIASTLYSYMTRPDDPGKQNDSGNDPGFRVNTRSSQEPLKIVYGVQKVGGNDVYMGNTQVQSHTDWTQSYYLWAVQTFGEGECDSINTVDGADQIWLGDHLEADFGSLVEYWFHSGASNQTVDANLAAAIPEWTDTLRNTCYMVWKLKFDVNYFQGLPARMVELKGRKVYDFRDATTAWSDNPVLCLYDYVTNSRYGLGISATKLDATSWAAAANYCDTKDFSLNIAINRDEAGIDTVNAILAHFRGALVWYDGKYYLRYSDTNEESSCMTLTDEHICQEPSGKASISISQPSRFEKPDAVRVRWIDPDNNWVTDDLMIGDDTGVVKSVDLLGCTDKEMAANLGVYNLERWQLDRTITGRFRGDALQLEPNDLCTLTSTALSISAQPMRVRDANLLSDGTIELVLAYESDVLYDDDYNLLVDNVYTCTLPDPSAEPPPVSNASVVEETYNYRLRTFTRLKVTFDDPADYAWFDHVEVWISYDDSTWEHLFDSTSDFEIANVEEGQDYWIRLKTVSIHGVKQQDANDRKLYKGVQGYIEAPDSVSYLSAVVTQNAVNLYAPKVDDTDVELYEFRMGSGWEGGIFLAATRAPNLSLAGVKPGTHSFLINTLGNNGQYGETARTASATLLDPPDGWTVQAALTKTCNYPEIGFTMKAAVSAVTITGHAARLTRVMPAAQGSVTITGQDATLTKL